MGIPGIKTPLGEHIELNQKFLDYLFASYSKHQAVIKRKLQPAHQAGNP